MEILTCTCIFESTPCLFGCSFHVRWSYFGSRRTVRDGGEFRGPAKTLAVLQGNGYSHLRLSFDRPANRSTRVILLKTRPWNVAGYLGDCGPNLKYPPTTHWMAVAWNATRQIGPMLCLSELALLCPRYLSDVVHTRGFRPGCHPVALPIHPWLRSTWFHSDISSMLMVPMRARQMQDVSPLSFGLISAIPPVTLTVQPVKRDNDSSKAEDMMAASPMSIDDLRALEPDARKRRIDRTRRAGARIWLYASVYGTVFFIRGSDLW